jgi:hypothetical protein
MRFGRNRHGDAPRLRSRLYARAVSQSTRSLHAGPIRRRDPAMNRCRLDPCQASAHDSRGSASWTGAGLGLQSQWYSARAAVRRVRFPCTSASEPARAAIARGFGQTRPNPDSLPGIAPWACVSSVCDHGLPVRAATPDDRTAHGMTRPARYDPYRARHEQGQQACSVAQRHGTRSAGAACSGSDYQSMTVRPRLRAVPAMTLAAASRSLVFMSPIFCSATSYTCLRVT